MTKNPEFQQELNERIKPGVKASDLKKLKRSKSADDLNTSSLTQPVSNQSAQQLQEQLTAAQEKLSNLQTSLGNQDPSLLRKAREELINLYQRLQTLFPDQTEAKPSELLELLITKQNELTDHILELRLENIQDFGKYREKLKEIEQELDQAAEKLVNTDQKKINLQVQNKQLLGEKKDLENRLQSANQRIQQLYQLKGLPNSVNNPNSDSF